MKKKLIAGLTIAFVAVLFMLPFLPATVIAAPAVRDDFDATMNFTGITTPEKIWVDEEGGIHARGIVETFTISGDLVGTGEVTLNENIVPPGSGDAQAKGAITTAGGDVYLISLDVTLTAWVPSGTFVIHGTGSCKGVHITGTIGATVGSIVILNGTIITTP